uniref:Uncharacterized protein n=1 Tax=Arundo donax TaxID=35708 RepID=A0A0A9EQU2_ARUDO
MVLAVEALLGANDQLEDCIVPCTGILQTGIGRSLAAQISP